MKKVTVDASQKYDVIIGRGVLNDAAGYIKGATKAKNFAVITDDNIPAEYYDLLCSGMDPDCTVTKFVFPHGEASKCSATLNDIYDFLARSGITRSGCIIAMGGGVTGDMAGYAAATFLRGLDYIQIPTSLLAQVDSSVGGKTAIDIPAGKNLVGAFKQPKLVLADIDTLKTLPEEYLIDGMGEVVKYGMIKSRELFDILLENNIGSVMDIMEDIVFRCVSIKRDVVEADEFEKGERMLLNFGHTLGHALEKYYDYRGITHGCAVAVGMAEITRLAVKNGMCSEETAALLEKCLANYGLSSTDKADINDYKLTCGFDKKRSGADISIVICSEPGVSSAVRMPVSDLLNKFIG